MKITERLIRTAVLSMILGSAGMAFILWILNPALMAYDPEDAQLFAEQRIAASASIFAGLVCAILFAKR